MNKAELIAAVAAAAEISKKDAETAFPLPWTPLPPL